MAALCRALRSSRQRRAGAGGSPSASWWYVRAGSPPKMPGWPVSPAFLAGAHPCAGCSDCFSSGYISLSVEQLTIELDRAREGLLTSTNNPPPCLWLWLRLEHHHQINLAATYGAELAGCIMPGLQQFFQATASPPGTRHNPTQSCLPYCIRETRAALCAVFC